MPAYDQNGAKFVRLVSVANPCTNGQSGAELLHPINDDGTDFSFGGGSQTPWISDIDAATFNLTNVALIKGPTADAFLSIGNGAQVVLYNNNNLGTGIDDTGVVSKHGNVYLDAAVAIDAVNSPIINLADPTNPQDAATKAYVDSSGGGSQTPWASDIDGNNHALTNVNGITMVANIDMGSFDINNCAYVNASFLGGAAWGGSMDASGNSLINPGNIGTVNEYVTFDESTGITFTDNNGAGLTFNGGGGDVTFTGWNSITTDTYINASGFYAGGTAGDSGTMLDGSTVVGGIITHIGP